MHPGGDYSSYYPHAYPPPSSFPNPPNPNLNPAEIPPSTPIQPSYASAPPYAPYPAEIPAAPYPPYSQSPDNPHSASPYYHPQPQSQSQSPHFQPYNAPQYPLQQPSSYYPPDAPQPAGGYSPAGNNSLNSGPSSNPNSRFPSAYPSYDIPYDGGAARFDQGSANFIDNMSSYRSAGSGSGYSRSSSAFQQDFYGKKQESGYRYDWGSGVDDGLATGVYAYDGGRAELYGGGGTLPKNSSSLFDDYGRSISSPSGGKDRGGGSQKTVKALPKVDAQHDVKNAVQKFRVKLLAEGSGQSTMDVLCQVGLDGIRMLDPNTNRTLRIYPLENVARWEVLDSSIFAFWSKSSVDVEARRIRLKSNSYTTSTILDTVTAATVQFKEMGGNNLTRSKGTADAFKPEQPTEKKKGFTDWMNLIKPPNEEKDHWVPDEAVTRCTACGADFGAFVRRHHCRNCGDIFCDKCTQGRTALTADESAQPVRVCDRCMAEVSHRLSIAKEAASKPVGLHSHEDLARKLQEEMDKNRKSSSDSRSSDGSGKRTREIACPVCTVHLQVQVPTSGSETIECGVCQHPFLVGAR